MSVVLYADDLEPITVLNLPEAAETYLRKYRVVRIPVIEPLSVSFYAEDISNWRPKSVVIHTELFIRRGKEHMMLVTHDERERIWIQGLRERGFKAAHPNDGWVNRETNEVVFAYPQFNDGAGIGALVMLGHAGYKNQRPVRLIAQRHGLLLYWQFEDVVTTRGLD